MKLSVRGSRLCVVGFGLWAGVLVTEPLAAQARDIVLYGRVVDDATGRPIGGAIAQLTAGQSARTARTDETGEFRFVGVGEGPINLRVRNIGFAPFDETVTVVNGMEQLSVRLRRIAVLDTVKVRAARQGLFGVVAAAKDLRPLPEAELRIVGVGGGRIRLDSAGRFFVPIHTVGSYYLRARSKGFAPQSISVIVVPNNPAEVAFLLDEASDDPDHQTEWAMGLFDDRLKRAGSMSAMLSRTELLQHGKKDILSAILFAPSFVKRNMRLTSEACVYIDGRPKPGIDLTAFLPDEIEAIEIYGSGKNGDRSGTLMNRWPLYASCSQTGLPRIRLTDDVVHWVSIWMRTG